MSAQKIIIDTDPGIDDSMAIFLAGLDPRLDLVGLTSIFGNVTTKIGTRNALRLVEKLGQTIPVAHGAEVPLSIAPNPPADFVHGAQGFGNVPAQEPEGKQDGRSAAEFLVDMANQFPGEIVLCPIGPLTNIAKALELDPSIAKKFKSVVIMGGAVTVVGNVSKYAEANIWNDPDAADAVFAADWPVTLVGLDVTQQVVCTPAEFEIMAQSSPKFGGFLQAATEFYFGFHKQTCGFDGCYMHDSTAVTYVTDPDLFTTAALPLRVKTEGEALGQTYSDGSSERPKVSVCLGVQSDKVKSIFLDTISKA